MRVTAELDPARVAIDGTDLAIVLHLRHGARLVRAFAGRSLPVVGAISGTDLYEPPGIEGDVLEACRRVVVLQPAAIARLPESIRARARVIRQSAVARGPAARFDGQLRACVLGHLRAVKAPFLPALALRQLSPDLDIEVVHAGAVIDDELRDEARRHGEADRRWRWIGPLPRRAAGALLSSSHLCIVPSRSEGGAGVIGEAAVQGVAVIASNADGNVGLLGADHPGLFPVGDVDALAALLRRCSRSAEFLETLRERSRSLADDFAPAGELAAWRELLAPLIDLVEG